MEPSLSLITSAIWLGILTSISPCPLATNLAALSYISGQKKKVLLAGLLYSLGRVLAYVALSFLLISSFLASPSVSFFLQKYMHLFLGPLLVLVGMVLLNLISPSLPSFGGGTKLKERIGKAGLLGAAPLGFIFALTFCPVSAALYFGSLLPLAMQSHSSFTIPALYGLGTALPVIAASIALLGGVKAASHFFNRATVADKWLRTSSGVIIVIIGIYLILRDVYRVF